MQSMWPQQIAGRRGGTGCHELIPAYDEPAYISHRLACYFIFHLLGGWATQSA